MSNEDKYVYQKESGKFVAVTYDDGKLSYHGTYDTKEEAINVRTNQVRGHHWEGIEPEVEKYGFIYSIVDLDNEQIYIGRKVYKGYNKFTEQRDLESGWEFYTSSSMPVQDAVDKGHKMRYTILCNTESNDESSVLEHELIRALVLRKLPSGNAMCLNGMVPKLFKRGLQEAVNSVGDTVQRLLRELP